MHGMLSIILLTAAAGACIPLGGFIAHKTRIQQHWLDKEFRHTIIALGAGILLGAVAIVLVPDALEHLDHSPWAIALLLSGGLLFYWLERYLDIHRRSSPQLTGMLLDYIPESLALGGIAASGADTTVLLAALIGLQNLPEGFNSFKELRDSGRSPNQILLLMLALVPLGPLVGLTGYTVLGSQHAILGGIMLIASGGILYLIFQDIAPQIPLRKHRSPALGAVIGFSIAMLGAVLNQY
ncbi:ZIP family metal transporter [Zhongshania sp. BJYM1]|uniref:ZIP family metal transporter n=1 Tax=Zhongshania aquatica TaxID=2965069 RepID=UPI0022B56A52|nr:divalent cation transporter [Marortus sp. BJYM1]